jgi:NADP-dependent aldehyde dehydrogenase
MQQAAVQLELPIHVIQHVADEGHATGKALVQHPHTAAVGFTGSYRGGMALQAYAQERKNPIPVFAEMGSVNPVLLLPGALQEHAKDFAEKYAGSITQSMGQFCTNPGLLLGIASPELDVFTHELVKHLQQFSASPMLHSGIKEAYLKKTTEALAQKGVTLLTPDIKDINQPVACLASISAKDFLANQLVQEEIFGPWSLLVLCEDAAEMLNCRKVLSGQITTSIIGTDADFAAHELLIDAAIQFAGRVVFNGVPTGVEVSNAMVHGGPQPASSDSRFTAVGAMSIQRWTRPVCWQNAPDAILPPELKAENPLHIRRLENGLMVQNV